MRLTMYFALPGVASGTAAEAHEVEVHRLGNLTNTADNSTLGNKSFPHKRERVDSAGGMGRARALMAAARA